MRCDEARDLALLRASGELAAADRHDLEAHLHGCPDCRAAVAAEEETLRAYSRHRRRRALPAGGREALLRAAAPETRQRRIVRLTGWALAAAAAVLLAVLLGLEISAPPAGQTPPAAEQPALADLPPLPAEQSPAPELLVEAEASLDSFQELMALIDLPAREPADATAAAEEDPAREALDDFADELESLGRGTWDV